MPCQLLNLEFLHVWVSIPDLNALPVVETGVVSPLGENYRSEYFVAFGNSTMKTSR